MIMVLKRFYWKTVARIKRARADGVYFYSIDKKSDTWPFDPVIELIETGKLKKQHRYHKKIQRIKSDMIATLGGTNRLTYFRHEKIQMDAGQCAEDVSSPEVGLKLVYEIVRLFKPAWVVEIGSAFGVGSMYLAEALKRNRTGSLSGIEFESWRAHIANKCLSSHWRAQGKIHAGRAEDIFPQLVAAGKKVDFVFVDAVHKYKDTMVYHRLLEKGVSEGAIVVYDDINWSEGMKRFWNELLLEETVEDAVLINGRWGIARYRPENKTNHKISKLVLSKPSK